MTETARDAARSAPVLATAVIALVAALGVAAPGAPERPGCFPLGVGHKWTYKTTSSDGASSEFTVKVVGERDGVFEVESDGAIPTRAWYRVTDDSVLMTRQALGKSMVRAGDLFASVPPPSGGSASSAAGSLSASKTDVEYSPPKRVLRLPLDYGRDWDWAGPDLGGADARESNSVEEEDLVEVPAGEFTAWKVVTEISVGGMQVTKKQWFANDVGLVKAVVERDSARTTTELVSFKVK